MSDKKTSCNWKIKGQFDIENAVFAAFGGGVFQKKSNQNLDFIIVSHNGAWVGYRTNIRNYPDQRFAFITLCNSDDNDLSGPYARAMTATFLKNYLKRDTVDHVKELPTRIVPVDVLNQYTGNWVLGSPANKVFSITVDSG